MDTLAVIAARYSTRVFAAKPLPKETIEKIVDAGRRAPTARNVQPWEFVVVTGAEMRKKIADLTDYGKFIAQAPACIAVFCKDTKYYLEDGCAATVNILLAATALGAQSCWVAGDKKPYCGAVGQLLDVPSVYKLISLIALGHADRPGKPTPKRELREVLHWEKF